MKPIDLSKAPPREPRAELAGLLFLPRTIDKIRAGLPGGILGAYNVEGFSTMMLDMLEIPLADFTEAVQRAGGDQDVAAFVLEHSSEKRRNRWNTFVAAREPRGGNRALALEVYPWLAERPDLVLALDVLAEDDVRNFAR